MNEGCLEVGGSVMSNSCEFSIQIVIISAIVSGLVSFVVSWCLQKQKQRWLEKMKQEHESALNEKLLSCQRILREENNKHIEAMKNIAYRSNDIGRIGGEIS